MNSGTPESDGSARAAWIWCALIVLAGVAAYANALQGAWLWDDVSGILENPHVRALFPLSESLSAPPETTITGRPVACFSFALNYAVSGYNIWSWKAINVAIQIASGLLLFGWIRTALARAPRLAAWAPQATPIAGATALLWTVHPLHTTTSNYVIQRVESLATLFALAALLLGALALERTGPARILLSAGVAVCAVLSMLSKESTAALPLLLLLYDYICVSGTMRGLARNGWLHAACMAAWAPLAYVIAQGGTLQSVPKAGKAALALDYLLAQGPAILQYVYLAVIPYPLIYDYGWPSPPLAVSLPAVAVVGCCFCAGLWLLAKRSPAAVPVLLPFLALGPSSSVIPLIFYCLEYRFGFALAGLLLLGVAGLWTLLARRMPRAQASAWFTGGTAALALIYIVMCLARNPIYHDPAALREDILRKAPWNAGAHMRLALDYVRQGRQREADALFQKALSLPPEETFTHYNYAGVLAQWGRMDESLREMKRAAEMAPANNGIQSDLAGLLAQMGRFAESESVFRELLRRDGANADARIGVAFTLARQNRRDEALKMLDPLLQRVPSDPRALQLIAQEKLAP